MFTLSRGRKGRLVGILAAIPLTLGVTVGVAQPAVATASETRYVALGDSYTAGQGGGSYLECNRSPFGYPYLVDDSFPSPVRNVACAAATTKDVRASQLPARPDWNVRLVTMTVGGNNLGFSELGRACLGQAGPTPTQTCEQILTVTPQESANLFTELVRTYWATKAAFPKARVVVLSYPRLVQPGYQEPGIPAEFFVAIGAAGEVVNRVIVAATKVSPVTFVDVRDEFLGHELGGPLDDWIHPLSSGPVDGLHPTPAGYQLGFYQGLVNAGIV